MIFNNLHSTEFRQFYVCSLKQVFKINVENSSLFWNTRISSRGCTTFTPLNSRVHVGFLIAHIPASWNSFLNINFIFNYTICKGKGCICTCTCFYIRLIYAIQGRENTFSYSHRELFEKDRNYFEFVLELHSSWGWLWKEISLICLVISFQT